MSTVTFDKKLAELDAYLQMLINENELLDKKLSDYSRASNATINNYERELEGIVRVRDNLEKLLGSIKHSIVLLQIAKVSSRASFSSLAGDLKPHQHLTKSGTPSPKSRLRLLKATSFGSSSSKETNRNKTGRLAAASKTLDESTSSCHSAAGTTRLDSFYSRQDGSHPQQQSVGAQASALSDSVKLNNSGSQRQDTPQSCRIEPPPRSKHNDGARMLASSSSTRQQPASSSAEIPPACKASDNDDEIDGGGCGQKGYMTNIRDHGVNSNGAHHRGETTSPTTRQRGDGGTNIAHGGRREGDADDDSNDDEDDDDDFFDADDVQQNQQLKSVSNLNSDLRLLSLDETTHPDCGHIVRATAETTTSNSRLRQHDSDNMMAEKNNNIESRTGDEAIDWDALYEEEDEDELGSLEGQGSVIKHLLSQIRIGMDLTKVVLPTFILERRSLLEMYADFFAHPDLFSNIPDFDTAEERMIQLVRWYLSAFHAGRKSSLAKKPYNPILGEIFRCQWRLETDVEQHNKRSRGTTNNNHKAETKTNDGNAQQTLTFVAEQVSHHPPVSAFYAENKAKGISCCAHIYTKSKYLGLSVGVHNIGQGVINLLKHNETYICTFPSAYGRSILTVPWVELGGPVTITCEQTGYKANIEFQMKPFYGGKKHRVTGEILRPNNEPIITIDGEWNGVMHSKSPPNSSSKQVFVDTTNLPVIKKHVKAVSVQDSFESRNVWKEVTRALKLKDVTSATAAKSFIEQRQRDLLRDRNEQGIKWATRYFEPAGEGWQFMAKADPNDTLQDCDGI